MFSVYCDQFDAEVLLGPRSILTIRNTDGGIVTAYRCRCGATGLLVTGRGARPSVPGHHLPAALDAGLALAS